MSPVFEGFLLFLIELGFIAIMGIMYVCLALMIFGFMQLIEKLLDWISDRLGVD